MIIRMPGKTSLLNIIVGKLPHMYNHKEQLASFIISEVIDIIKSAYDDDTYNMLVSSKIMTFVSSDNTSMVISIDYDRDSDRVTIYGKSVHMDSDDAPYEFKIPVNNIYKTMFDIFIEP